VKKAFFVSMLIASANVFGNNPFQPDAQIQRENKRQMEVTRNFLNQFDEALKKSDRFAKEYLYAWGASVSFTRQDRDANLRVLCERIGSFLLITALKHEKYNIVNFLKDHGADADKTFCYVMQ